MLAALLLAASQGWSHDSWLSPSRGGAPSGQVALELATGNRYPVQEFGQSAAEMPLDEKNRISHRGKALAGLKQRLQTIL